jgi:hypothetical protein
MSEIGDIAGSLKADRVIVAIDKRSSGRQIGPAMMGATGLRSRLSHGIRSQLVAVSAAFPDFTAAPIKSDPDVVAAA